MYDSLFQIFLDDISRCFIERDFTRWEERIVLPFTLVTGAGPVVLSTSEQLFDNFQLYLSACDTMHLDQIIRRPLGLEDCKDGTWIGSYETNLLSHGVRAVAPYTSSALMVKPDSSFKMLSILNARGHHDWTGKQPRKFH